MKTISRYIMTLALLLTAATGAWADSFSTEAYTADATLSAVSVTGNTTLTINEGVTVTVNNGLSIQSNATLTVTGGGTLAVNGANGADGQNEGLGVDPEMGEEVWVNATPGGNGYAGIVIDNGSNLIIINATIIAVGGKGGQGGKYEDESYAANGADGNGFSSFPTIDGAVLSYSTNGTDYTEYAPGNSTLYRYMKAVAAGPAVTINDDKTEATIKMPTSDVTVDYELVRDMSVQMQAQVGDDATKQPRYRVQWNDEKDTFEPADMDMMQVLELFSVYDGIEGTTVAPKNYRVNIWAVDDEGNPTGEAMNFTTFTFAPGRYCVTASALLDAPYDGTTAPSNIFELFQGYEVVIPAGEYITYYKDEALYVEDEDAKLYTITTVGNETATATELTVAAANTPLLVKNNAAETKTILLIPTTATPDEVTPYEGFKGTLEATQIAASTATQNNYALNGKEFVWVMEAIDIAANRAWLEVPAATTNGRALQIVFGDVTGINGVNGVREVNDGSWYDLNGRKLQAAPTKKGVYILNGKKVVVR